MKACYGSIVLIGAMGSGKSHIAREVARLAGLPSHDLDALIVGRAGKSIAEVFKTRGEAAFRTLETEVLRHALTCGGIIASGGGVITQEINRRLLCESGARIVYLRALPETLAHRIRLQPGSRPLIDGDGLLNHEETVVRIEQILQSRAPFYEACAHYTVDTDDRQPREVAHEIWDILNNDSPII